MRTDPCGFWDDHQTDGAKIIDVGGESTRPGYERISDQEEINRIVPVIRALAAEVPVIISVDTYKAEVARQGFRYLCLFECKPIL